MGLTLVKGTSVRKKDDPSDPKHHVLGPSFDQKSIKDRFTNSSKKRARKNMEFDVKGVPKWNQNRCQNSSKVNAQTGNEKDQENHKKSCFSEG